MSIFKSVWIGIVCLGITACASSPEDEYAKRLQEQQERVAKIKAQQDELKAQSIEDAIVEVPPWFFQAPANNGSGYYGTGTGLSSTMQGATDKARIRAESEIGRKYSNDVATNAKDYRASVSSNAAAGDTVSESTEVTIDAFSTSRLSNLEIVDYKILREGTQYRVYVLMYGSNQVFDKTDLLNDVREEAAQAHEALQERVKAERASASTSALWMP